MLPFPPFVENGFAPGGGKAYGAYGGRAMLKLLAKTAAALSLMLTGTFAVPAWARDSVDERKCTGAKHAQANRQAVTPVRKATPARGVSVVEKRKLDVQILSFGP